jgi:predicted nucleic acid-binding protein
VEPGCPHHQPALDAVALLHGQGEALAVCAQNLVEFYAIACRPINGLGMTPSEALTEITNIQSRFHVLPEVPIQSKWQELAARYLVVGKLVFDMRLVATAIVGSCSTILTFNDADFLRFSEVQILNPFDVVGMPRV